MPQSPPTHAITWDTVAQPKSPANQPEQPAERLAVLGRRWMTRIRIHSERDADVRLPTVGDGMSRSVVCVIASCLKNQRRLMELLAMPPPVPAPAAAPLDAVSIRRSVPSYSFRFPRRRYSNSC